MRRALLLAVLLACAASPALADRPALVIRGPRGTVHIVDGRIAPIGEVLPVGAEVIEVTGQIWSGFIDAGSLLGGNPAGPRAVTADVDALDAFDSYADRRRVLAGGVTIAVVDPGRRRLVPGLSGIVRLGDGEVLRRPNALHIVLTAGGRNAAAVFEPPVAPDPETEPLDPPKIQLPTTLAGAVLRLRELFRMAKGEGEVRAGEAAPHGLPRLAAALRGEIPVVFHADRKAEIRAALALTTEFGLVTILAGGEEAGEVAKEIRAAKVPVILDVRFSPGRMAVNEDPEEIERRETALSAAAKLNAAAVPFCFRSAGDPADLYLLASRFARDGFDRDRLLIALTSRAARILGIDDRAGALIEGRRADLVVVDASGDIELVVSGGQVVHRAMAKGEGLVVAGAEVHVGDGTVHRDASVIVADGRIVSLESGTAPRGNRKLVVGAAVVPGFIDARGYVGLLDPKSRARPPSQLPLSTPVGRALVPGDPSFAPVLRAGITTFIATPPGTGTIPGTASVAHTAGETRADLLRKETAAVCVKVAGTRDLAATIDGLTRTLDQAKGYAAGIAAYGKAKAEYDAWVEGGKKGDEKKPPRPPRRDSNREPWRMVIDGEIPVVVQVSTARETREVLKLFREKYDVRLVLAGADRAVALAPEMARRDVAVILGPRLIVDTAEGPVNLPAAYSRAGVTVLFGSSGTTGASSLPPTVAHAASRGFGRTAALRAFTVDAAERFGVANETGAVKPGLSADLLVLSGSPFHPATRVTAVIRGGRVVWEEKR